MPLPNTPDEMKKFADQMRPKFHADATTKVIEKTIKLPRFFGFKKELVIDCENKDLAVDAIFLGPGTTLKLLNLRNTVMTRGNFFRHSASKFIVTRAGDEKQEEHIVPVEIPVRPIVQE